MKRSLKAKIVADEYEYDAKDSKVSRGPWSLKRVVPLIAGVFLVGLLVGSSMHPAAAADSRALRGEAPSEAPASEAPVKREWLDPRIFGKPFMGSAPPPQTDEPAPPAPSGGPPRAGGGPLPPLAARPAAAAGNHPIVRESFDARAARVASLQADGTESSRYAEATAPFDFASGTSLCAWVFVAGGDGRAAIQTVASSRNSGCEVGASQNGFSLAVNSWETADMQLILEWGDVASGCRKLASGLALVYDKWTFCCATLDSSGAASLAIDGAVVSVVRAGHPRQPQKSLNLRLGQYVDGLHSFRGNISSVSVFSTPLDATAIAEAFQRSRPGDDPRVALSQFSHFGHLSAAFSLDASEPSELTYRGRAPHASNLKTEKSGNLYAIPGGGFSLGFDSASYNAVKDDALARQRRSAVRGAMEHAWAGYKAHAWGKDEVQPVSARGRDNWGSLGVTLVDSLDTLWVMGMQAEFDEAKEWVRTSLRFDRTGDVSVFETTIRELGGLIAAFDVSGDRVFLDKALDLGRRLACCFDTPSGLPRGTANLKNGRGRDVEWTGGNAVLAELGSLQVEFRYLASVSGNADFATKANRVFETCATIPTTDGLLPIYLSPINAQTRSRKITFGALGDSYYEYLLKVWIQGGKVEAKLRDMYDRAIDGMVRTLLNRSSPSNLAYVADSDGGIVHKMDHLACFLAGTLALGAATDPLGPDSDRAKRDLHVAQALTHTCVQMYSRMPAKLSPEYVTFSHGRDFAAAPSAPFNILRPETAESLFYLHELTGLPIYREWAWNIFQAIDSHCKVRAGFGGHPDVRDANRKPEDRMESFFLAETLKYLYLIQDPDHSCQLDRVVFNTEAHPLRILGPEGVHISKFLSSL